MEQPRSTSQKLPAGLAGVLNSPEDNRDSAYFSSTDASSSKHTSAASGMGISVFSPTGSGFYTSADKTPSPTAPNGHSHVMSPNPPNGNMSVASMVSPTTPGGLGPNTSADARRGFDRPQPLESAPGNAIYAAGGDIPEALSRRESVDSRINQGFTDMRLNNSPYASHNQSTTSIHQSLQQQRHPRPGYDNLVTHRISNGYQPSAERNPDGQTKTMRLAPAITGPAQGTIARAAEPTKGQAWAFPEEEIQRMPSGANHSQMTSRRSSVADSFASSQFTTESRLPPGQRRLEDGMGAPDYHRLSSASGELPGLHHHSLQNKQLADLQADDALGLSGTQPYSRTPELRQSHKLAERKRRTEMKELFEQLRDLMPQERGSKASKWEILTKAIAEHQRQAENIRILQNHIQGQQNEIDMMKRELHALRMENDRTRPQHQPPAQPSMQGSYTNDQFRPRPEQLPPLRSLQGPAPDSMTGVQYEQPRTNSFRTSDPPRF